MLCDSPRKRKWKSLRTFKGLIIWEVTGHTHHSSVTNTDSNSLTIKDKKWGGALENCLTDMQVSLKTFRGSGEEKKGKEVTEEHLKQMDHIQDQCGDSIYTSAERSASGLQEFPCLNT